MGYTYILYFLKAPWLDNIKRKQSGAVTQMLGGLPNIHKMHKSSEFDSQQHPRRGGMNEDRWFGQAGLTVF